MSGASPWFGRRASTVAVGYAFAVAMLGTTMPTPLYPLYQQRIHFSDLVVTIVYAAYGIGVLATLLLAGGLSDRYGRRALLGPGLAVAGASSVVFLLADGLAALFVGRILSGLSAGIFTGTATAALLDLAPAKGRQRATLIATVVNIGGLGLGPLLSGALAQLAPDPLRTPYAVHLALLLPAAALIWLMPEPAEIEPRHSGRGLRVARLRVPPEVRGTFVRAATAAFSAFATLGLFSAVAPAFLGKLLGERSHLLTGTVVFVAFAASTAGQLALERFPAQLALPIGCGVVIVGMGLIASGLAVSSLALLIVGAVGAGFGSGLSFRGALGAINAESPPESRGEVNSSLFVVAYLALSIPIVGIGIAAQAFGLRAAGLAFSACVALLALLVLVSQLQLISPRATARQASQRGQGGSHG
jgi:MFS family permease